MKFSLMTFMVVIRKLMAGAMTGEDKRDYSDFLKNIKTAGLDHVDLSTMELSAFGDAHVKEMLWEYDLKTSCLLAGRPYATLGAPVAEDFKRDVELAQSLGCRIIMAVPFGYETQQLARQDLGNLLKTNFRAISDYAFSQGITVVIEDDPHLTLPMCSAAELADLLSAAPHLRMVFDTANMVLAGDDPADFFRQFRSKIAHMHIKDIITVTDPNAYGDKGIDGQRYAAAKFGDGLIDLTTLLPLIENSGYDGFGALEFVSSAPIPSVDEIRREMDFVKAVI